MRDKKQTVCNSGRCCLFTCSLGSEQIGCAPPAEHATACAGTPCSLKDAACLTDRKPTNNEEYGTTLILSVDDEPVNHMVIEECISTTGYKV